MAVVVASLVVVAVALAVAVAMAIAVAVARVRVRVVALAMKAVVVPIGGEMTGAVVVELAVAVVVAVVVEVEVAVAGDVPFGPPNEIKIKSTLDNMLVHLLQCPVQLSPVKTRGYRLVWATLNTDASSAILDL